jgi:hypothetical protein|tara:strand:- start:1342 stop:1695 length:354 start_codon:yes stop_codon:yes gene_type:complete
MNTYILANAEEIYKVNALLSDKQLEDIFGTKDVSLKERAVYFGDLWDSWEENQVRLPAKAVEHYSRYKLQLEYLDVKKVIKDFTEKHELKEMIDYQIKGHTVRFKDSQYAFLMRLSI